MLASFLSAWNEFFHSRFSTKCRAIGHPATVAFIRYLRIAYGLCLLYDRLILSFDFRMFYLYPTTHPASSLRGAMLPLFPCQQYLLPVRNTMTHSIVDVYLPYSPLCSIAEQLPISYHNVIYYLFHIVSIVNAILLICNIYPKLQLVLLHINMMSFHYHSLLIWDGEDVMFKVWNFLFLFLPLQSPPPSSSLTVPKSSAPTSSYPMWPIRLFQIELCCIYAGAGYAKLSTETWRSGNAMYHVRTILIPVMAIVKTVMYLSSSSSQLPLFVCCSVSPERNHDNKCAGDTRKRLFWWSLRTGIHF